MRFALFTVLALAPLSARAADSGYQDLGSVLLNIPSGSTYYDVTLNQTVTTNKIKVEYDVTSACPESPSVNIEVQAPGSSQWIETTQGSDQAYAFSGGQVAHVRMNFEETVYRAVECNFTLSAATGGGTDNPTGNETLLGVITYGGGFVQRAQLDLAAAAMVTGFRLAIPTFCGQVDVLEAGTITEGVYQASTGTDAASHAFSVNGGDGMVIKSIAASLNGPATSSCTIPVYGTVKAD